ncbi:PhzF family phenazine biosynthesis protein, partial [Achromobacter ruhlandii]|uniref:PhzF family phenazine biosynthesis protein n=1 Tax=Achromobacter ruhlandii TaxID=72557 RepID=UPI002015FAD9
MRYRYVTADVFTEHAYQGNPLAVVLEAEGLDTAQMQRIAREFNYSETSFVLPARDAAHTAWVRIFTPDREVPFAGHPNVGTAVVLARAMIAPGPPRPPRLPFRAGAGPRRTSPPCCVGGRLPAAPLRPQPTLPRATPGPSPPAGRPARTRVGSGGGAGWGRIDLRYGDDGRLLGAELAAPQPLTRASQVTAEAAARALSLAPGDILLSEHAPQVASVGLIFLVVQLASRDALRRARPDPAGYAALLPLDGARSIYAYTTDCGAETPLGATPIQTATCHRPPPPGPPPPRPPFPAPSPDPPPATPA